MARSAGMHHHNDERFDARTTPAVSCWDPAAESCRGSGLPLRTAATPAAKAPELERQVEQAPEQVRQIGALVVRSGHTLVSDLTDADLRAAVDEAVGEVRAIVEGLPEIAQQVRADIARAGALGAEASWTARLLERRRAYPFRGGAASPPGPRLAAAARAAGVLEAEVAEELRERERRAAGPPAHHAPRGAPEGFTVGPLSA